MYPKKMGLQLMLVDPDDDLRFLLKTLLELAGCQVETAKNCTEAYARIEESQPSVIFTELRLEDVTGLDFAKRIRSTPLVKDAWLIALTGHYYPGIAQDARDAGFDRYLLKPVQYDQILNVLRLATKIRDCSLSELGCAPGALSHQQHGHW